MACDTIPTVRDNDDTEPDKTFVLQVMTKDSNSFIPGTMNKMTVTINDGKNNYNISCSSVLLSA